MGIDSWIRDLRAAHRALGRSPGFALLVVMTLAAGIAAAAVVMGVFSPYFLRPLPFAQPERVAHLGLVDPETGWDMARFSAPQLLDLRRESRSFSELGGYYYGNVNLSGSDASVPPERLMTAFVTGELMPLLGTGAAHGRALDLQDAGTDVVVVSHGLWHRRWGGDADLLGRDVRIDETPHTVVGIMPAHFSFPFNEIELWMPLEPLSPGGPRSGVGHLVVGRLQDGVSLEQSRAELATLHGRLAERYPEVDGEYSGIVVKDLREALNFAWEPLRLSFFLLSAAVGALLLLACANVANLVLARVLERQGELAVRAALGGGRGDLIRPILLESALLALLGGALGLLLARLGLAALAPFAPPSLFRIGDYGLDPIVARTALGIALATPLVFGLLPAWRVASGAFRDAWLGGSRAGGSPSAARGRRALVVAQVTLAVLLVAGAVLMSRSLVALQSLDLGFPAERILVAQLSPPEARYPAGEELEAFYDRIESQLAAVPGVRAAGSTSRLPLNHETLPVWLGTADTDLDPDAWPRGYVSGASPTYFAAMQIPLLRGRPFRSGDSDSDAVVISRAFAERLWPGEDPLGQTLQWHVGGEPRAARIVGTVGDVRFDGVAGSPVGHLYLPMDGHSRRGRLVAIGTEGPPESLAHHAREAIAGIDPSLPVTLRPMPEIVRESTLQWSLSSAFLTVFGILALGLASLGIFGIVAWSVRSRRHEIGIRMALGAGRRRILSWVLHDGLRLAVWGCALGLASIAALSPVLGAVLYGVGALDPLSLGGVALLLLSAAALAAWIPARRAASQAPAEVLRQD
ncbi:MAG: ADOP family duplicated permease [Holophagales bacterium]|nr:ADOP family duplicated permease [Holophagales bacterium]